MIDDASLGFLRTAARILKNLDQDILDVLRRVPPETQVDVGQTLSDIHRNAAKVLETVKETLRAQARLRMSETCGSVVLRGHTTRCVVHFPRPSVRLRKGADIESLRQLLGDRFGLFFQTTYNPTPDFLDQVEGLTEDDIAEITRAVDMSSTPRVTFEDGKCE